MIIIVRSKTFFSKDVINKNVACSCNSQNTGVLERMSASNMRNAVRDCQKLTLSQKALTSYYFCVCCLYLPSKAMSLY